MGSAAGRPRRRASPAAGGFSFGAPAPAPAAAAGSPAGACAPASASAKARRRSRPRAARTASASGAPADEAPKSPQEQWDAAPRADPDAPPPEPSAGDSTEAAKARSAFDEVDSSGAYQLTGRRT